MRYTFGQAKQALAQHMSAFGLVDQAATLNQAIDELSRSRVWQRLRKVVRLTVTDQYFSLPQDCGSILRAAIDSVPVSIRSTEYEFLHSGPGDLDFAESGMAPLNGLQRLGVFPTMYDMPDILPLAAFTTGTPPVAALKVRGKNGDGDRVVVNVPITQWTGVDDVDTLDVATVDKTAVSIAEIDSVTVPSDAESYISLLAVGDEFSSISRMHPKTTIPEFTRYRLPGFYNKTDMSYKVLAEVSLRFMQLVDDDDVVPFDSLMPIQLMLQSMFSLASGEIKAATEFRSNAEGLLIRREENELERQTCIVINPLYDGSIGQASDNYANI